MHARWFVVVAYSGGGGWTNPRSTSTLIYMGDHLDALDYGFSSIVSTCFNDEESKKFIAVFQVDGQRLEKMHIEVANNPFLLSLFRNTVENSTRFDLGVRRFEKKMIDLTRTFVSTVNDPVYKTAFNDCLKFLEYARHNVVLCPGE